MGLYESSDIFQEKMSEFEAHFEFVRAYIDDIINLTKHTLENHFDNLKIVFEKL